MTPARFVVFAAVLALISALAQAAPATLIRSSELKKEPATDAETVAALDEGAAVETAERRGGWVQVKTAAGASGWVKFLALRYAGTGAAPPASSGVGQLFSVARTGTSGSQATTGVRGLEAQDISSAQPNAAALQTMEGYAVSPGDAEQFAAQGPLQAQSVEYPKAEQ